MLAIPEECAIFLHSMFIDACWLLASGMDVIEPREWPTIVHVMLFQRLASPCADHSLITDSS